MGAGDFDFREQAQRAATEIPNAEFTSLAGLDHIGAHMGQGIRLSRRFSARCVLTSHKPSDRGDCRAPRRTSARFAQCSVKTTAKVVLRAWLRLQGHLIGWPGST